MLKNKDFPAVRARPATEFLTPTPSTPTSSAGSTSSISSLGSNYPDSLSESVYQIDEDEIKIRAALPRNLRNSDIAILYNNDESIESPLVNESNITIRSHRSRTPPSINESNITNRESRTSPQIDETHITFRRHRSRTPPSDQDLPTSPSDQDLPTSPSSTSHDDQGEVHVLRLHRTVYALSPDKKVAYALHQKQLGRRLEDINIMEMKFAEWEESELEESELEQLDWRAVFDSARFGALVQADALKDALEDQTEGDGEGKVEDKGEGGSNLFLRF